MQNSPAITAAPTDTENYNEQTATYTVNTVGKINPQVTAPKANSITYNGEAHALVSGGTTTGGSMQYAIGTNTEEPTSYSETIPSKTNAGTYYVWYKVVGDNNYNDGDLEKTKQDILNTLHQDKI